MERNSLQENCTITIKYGTDRLLISTEGFDNIAIPKHHSDDAITSEVQQRTLKITEMIANALGLMLVPLTALTPENINPITEIVLKEVKKGYVQGCTEKAELGILMKSELVACGVSREEANKQIRTERIYESMKRMTAFIEAISKLNNK